MNDKPKPTDKFVIDIQWIWKYASTAEEAVSIAFYHLNEEAEGENNHRIILRPDKGEWMKLPATTRAAAVTALKTSGKVALQSMFGDNCIGDIVFVQELEAARKEWRKIQKEMEKAGGESLKPMPHL